MPDLQNSFNPLGRSPFDHGELFMASLSNENFVILGIGLVLAGIVIGKGIGTLRQIHREDRGGWSPYRRQRWYMIGGVILAVGILATGLIASDIDLRR